MMMLFLFPCTIISILPLTSTFTFQSKLCDHGIMSMIPVGVSPLQCQAFSVGGAGETVQEEEGFYPASSSGSCPCRSWCWWEDHSVGVRPSSDALSPNTPGMGNPSATSQPEPSMVVATSCSTPTPGLPSTLVPPLPLLAFPSGVLSPVALLMLRSSRHGHHVTSCLHQRPQSCCMPAQTATDGGLPAPWRGCFLLSQ